MVRGDAGAQLTDQDRLVATCRLLAARDAPVPGSSPAHIRDRIGEWLIDGGTQFSIFSTGWKETVSKTRTNTHVLTLRLALDLSRGVQGIAFSEHYDYFAGPGGAGREYAYTTHAP